LSASGGTVTGATTSSLALSLAACYIVRKITVEDRDRGHDFLMELNPEKHVDAAHTFLDQIRLLGRPPTRETLEALLQHYARLPYENVSKILKLHRHFNDQTRIRLPEEVVEEHWRYHFGGTCFSLTFTLETILKFAGFVCYPVMAHMRAGPNTHSALVVFLEKTPHLVDPGYLLRYPLRLDKDLRRIYHTPFTGVELRFDHRDESYNVWTFNRQERKWRYKFWDKPTPPHEFLQHWLDSFYRPTMHGICISQTTETGLLYLHNNYFRRTTLEGKETRRLKGDLSPVVESVFGIPGELVEAALAALEENLRLEREMGIFKPRGLR